MKIDALNQYEFDSVSNLVSYVIQTLISRQRRYPRVTFPQLTAFFSTKETERQFFVLLYEMLPRYSIVIQNNISEKIDHEKIRYIFIEQSEDIEYAMDFMSHWFPEPYPGGSGWDGSVIMRTPSIGTFAVMSVYARCHNLFLVTTLMDDTRNKVLVVFP